MAKTARIDSDLNILDRVCASEWSQPEKVEFYKHPCKCKGGKYGKFDSFYNGQIHSSITDQIKVSDFYAILQYVYYHKNLKIYFTWQYDITVYSINFLGVWNVIVVMWNLVVKITTTRSILHSRVQGMSFGHLDTIVYFILSIYEISRGCQGPTIVIKHLD